MKEHHKFRGRFYFISAVDLWVESIASSAVECQITSVLLDKCYIQHSAITWTPEKAACSESIQVFTVLPFFICTLTYSGTSPVPLLQNVLLKINSKNWTLKISLSCTWIKKLEMIWYMEKSCDDDGTGDNTLFGAFSLVLSA